jgi:RNA polymerase sigma-70 factor (ECF subfamily)
MLCLVSERGTYNAAEDEVLVDRARRGDRASFDLLVGRHLSNAWTTAWRLVRDRDDAQDVVQESFLTSWKSLGSFRGEAAFSTWLHRIVVTRALNHMDRAAERIRRASRSLLSTASDGNPGPDPDPGVERAARPSEPGPLARLEARDRLRRLADCFHRLPPAWRTVVALRDGEERAYEEIAEILGIALGTVRSRLARSRLALKQCVEGESP